jgi:hypothetical protein
MAKPKNSGLSGSDEGSFRDDAGTFERAAGASEDMAKMSQKAKAAWSSISNSAKSFSSSMSSAFGDVLGGTDAVLKRVQSQLSIERSLTEEIISQKEQHKQIEAAVSKLGSKTDRSLKEEETYNALVDQQQSLSDILKKSSARLVKERALLAVFTPINIAMESGNKLLAVTGKHWDNVKNFSLSVLSIVKVLPALLDASIARYVELESAYKSMRDDSGLIIRQTEELEPIVRQLNVEYAKFGVTTEAVARSVSESTKAFGSMNLIVGGDLLRSSVLLAANYGIAEQTTAKLYINLGGMTKLVGQTEESLMASLVVLSDLAGVPVRETFNDIANASNDTLTFLSKSPMQMMRTAVEARRLGTTLDNLSKTGRGLLNYQDSMTAELELSALLNKNVSFQLARQYQWEGKLIEAREESLRQIGTIDEFNRMNVFQKEAAAKAANMEVSEIVKQLSIRKKLGVYEQDLSDQLLNAQKNATTLSGKDKELNDKNLLSISARLNKFRDYKSQKENLMGTESEFDKVSVRRAFELEMRQDRISKLTNKMADVWTKISDKLLGIAETVFPMIESSLTGISSILDEMNTEGMITAILATLAVATLAMWGFWTLVKAITVKASVGIATAVRRSIMSAAGDAAAGGMRATEEATRGATDAAGRVASRPGLGARIKSFLTDLSLGLKELASGKALGGTVVLGAAGVAFVPWILGAPGATLVSRINGAKLQEVLVGMAIGLEKMGSWKAVGGVVVLSLAAAAFTGMILGSIGLGLVAVLGIPAQMGLTGLAKGLESMSTGKVFIGIGAMALIAASVGLLGFSLTKFTKIDFTVMGQAAAAIAIFTGAIFALGAIMSTGYGAIALVLGAAALAGFGLALGVFGIGVQVVANSMGPLADGFKKLSDSLSEITNVALMLPIAAIGIGMVSAALMAFAGASVMGKLTSMFASDPFAPLERLAELGGKLTKAAAAILSIKSSLLSLSGVNVKSLDLDAVIVGKVKGELKPVKVDTVVELIPKVDINLRSLNDLVMKELKSALKNVSYNGPEIKLTPEIQTGLNSIKITPKIEIDVGELERKVGSAIADISVKLKEKITASIEVSTNAIVEVKNLDALKEVVSKLTDAVTKLGEVGTRNSPPVESQQSKVDNSAVVNKIEELITLLRSGVDIDFDTNKLSGKTARRSGT